MKKLIPTLACLTVPMFAASAADIDERNRFGLSYRIVHNVKADFGGLGAFTALSAPAAAAGAAVDRSYDDGFNMVDTSGNAGGLTTFWGYTGAGQVAGGSLTMNSSSSAGGVSSEDAGDDPHHGFEVSYGRRIGRVRDKGWWGLEGGFNFTSVGIGDNRALTGNVTTISDAYALGGIVPPVAPYSGTFAGPGPLLGSTPTRTTATTAGGSTITGARNLDAEIYGFRIGPFVEIPLGRRVGVELGGGLAFAHVASDYAITQTVTIPAAGATTTTGAESGGDMVVGGYVRGLLTVPVRQRTELFAGAEFSHLSKATRSAIGTTAELDLGKSVAVNIGIRFSF